MLITIPVFHGELFRITVDVAMIEYLYISSRSPYEGILEVLLFIIPRASTLVILMNGSFAHF